MRVVVSFYIILNNTKNIYKLLSKLLSQLLNTFVVYNVECTLAICQKVITTICIRNRSKHTARVEGTSKFSNSMVPRERH